MIAALFLFAMLAGGSAAALGVHLLRQNSKLLRRNQELERKDAEMLAKLRVQLELGNYEAAQTARSLLEGM